MKPKKAFFGAGCFWHPEEEFIHLPGVKATAVGFMGGQKENPSYEQVCSGDTGHTEVVQLVYDPSEISYEQLLQKFWQIHDPTQVNRQGADVGYQYRSVIFYDTPEQETKARKLKQALEKSGRYARPIATALEPASIFWRAEEDHQQYYHKTGLKTCRA